MHPKINRSKRNFLRWAAGGLLLPWLQSCAMEPIIERGLFDKKAKQKVNLKALWARRQEWKGKEEVRGVVFVEDRYLMVRGADPLGWVFPGGPLSEALHGKRSPRALDIQRAAEDYVHSQALVQVWGREAIIESYGYGIDQTDPDLKMIYWVRVAVPALALPMPQANLDTVQEVKWVAFDHPTVSACLRQRLDEMEQARQGGTVVLNLCRDY